MEGYWIGWPGLALLNAALANLDGRSPLKYFLVSLLLGPFVTLFIAATYEDDGGHLHQADLWRGQRRARSR